MIVVAGVVAALTLATATDGRPQIAPSGHMHLVSGDGSRPIEQPIVNRSKMPIPTQTITVNHFQPDDDPPCVNRAVACATPGTMWFSSVDYYGDPETIWHETGHEFDDYVMDNQARAEFLLVHHDTRAWLSPPNSPNEQFAEAYALCSEYGYANPPQPIHMDYQYQATLEQQRRICSLIRRTAIRHPQGPRR